MADSWADFRAVSAPAAKADPWADFHEVSAPSQAEPFPTPAQTVGRIATGALKAIPGMALGTMEAAMGPLTAPMREVASFVQGKPSPTMEQIRQSAGAIQRGDYLGAVPVVGPAVMGAVRGGQEIAAPLAKTIVSGVGTVTPEEMNAAADTGGAAIAGLAAPELARGGVALAGKMSPGVGKVLSFSRDHAPTVAKAAFSAASGHPVMAAKIIASKVLTSKFIKSLGTIDQDAILSGVAKGDVEGTSAAIGKALDKYPEARSAFADALEEEAAKADIVVPNATTYVSPADLPPMSDTSSNAIAARAADRTARQRAALARRGAPAPVVAPGASSALQRPAFVDEAAGVQAPPDTMPGGYPRGAPVNRAAPVGMWEPTDPLPEPARTPQMPVPGNVKPATIYTKPGPKVKPIPGESEAARALAEKQKAVASPDAIRAAFGETPKGSTHGKKGPSGAPLTAAERKEALIKLQRAIAADQDVFSAFGLEN